MALINILPGNFYRTEAGKVVEKNFTQGDTTWYIFTIQNVSKEYIFNNMELAGVHISPSNDGVRVGRTILQFSSLYPNCPGDVPCTNEIKIELHATDDSATGEFDIATHLNFDLEKVGGNSTSATFHQKFVVQPD